jgi:hypothetical protein
MPLVVVGSGLPVSLALLFPWGPDVAREAALGPDDERAAHAGRALGVAFVVAIGVYMLFGVANERYAMPALVLLPPLVAYVARGAAGGFVPLRGRIAQRLLLHPARWAWPVLLGLGVAVYASVIDPREAQERSGKASGLAIGASLPDGAEVWADGLINAKPEVLWYAQRRAGEQGTPVRVRWMRPWARHAAVMVGAGAGAGAGGDLPAGTLALLNSAELAALKELGAAPEVLLQGRADRIDWFLVRAGGPDAEAGRGTPLGTTIE